MNRVRWGIVSAGAITHTFARDMAFVPNAEIVAVAARRLDAAQRFARTYDIPNAYEGYDALFADAEVDAVYIATPHALHLRHSKDALKAGKPVLCEKPLTVSAEECRELIDAAARHERYLMEAMWTWFLPAIRKAKEWADAGRIGELINIKADFGYPAEYSPDSRRYDVTLGGGCMLEMGVYPVALARYFTGRNPGDVSAVSTYAPNGVEDDVSMLFTYDTLAASLGTSYRCKLQNHAYIIGTEAYIQIPDFWRAHECHLYVLDDRVDSFDDGRRGSGFEFQLEAVSDDILHGRLESEVVTHTDSLAFQELIDRVKRTA